MPRLENWSVVIDDKPYMAPELLCKRLNGEIYDDEQQRFSNGTEVTTSTLIKLDFKNKIAQTRNSVYVLGAPSEDYLKWANDNHVNLGSLVD